MADFTLHDAETAPEASRPLLDKSKAAFGRIPGLHAVMAEAPGLLEGYQVLHQLFVNSSFDKDEKTVVWQAINVEHACHYCVPAHTGIAKMMKVDDAVTEDSTEDYWLYTVTTVDAEVQVDVAFVHAYGNIDLRVFNPLEGSVSGGTTISQTDNETVTFTAATVGDYFIRVSYPGDTACNDYTLSVTEL